MTTAELNILALALILLKPTLILMREYEASQKILHFRKKSGRTFVNNPVRHFI